MPDRGPMRKVIVELDPSRLCSDLDTARLFEKAEYLELRQFLKLDYEKGTKIVLEDIKTRPGCRLEDVEMPPGIEILTVLTRDRDKYTCLLRSNADAALRRLMGISWEEAKRIPPISETRLLAEGDLNRILDPPVFISRDRAVFGFIGDRQTIEVTLKLLRFLGLVKRVSFPRSSMMNNDLLSSLTPRQQEAICQAKKLGYYDDYPRRITTEELAQSLGLKKTTLIEHLRKAENRLVSRAVNR